MIRRPLDRATTATVDGENDQIETGRETRAVCQFLIVLPRTDPLVWRRVQVPEGYSFWDLHVAIQDAMVGKTVTSTSSSSLTRSTDG